MTLAQQAVAELENARQCFTRSTRALTEAAAGARPAAGMMTAAQQVAHVAQTIDWFIEGAFSAHGFDTDFEAHQQALERYTSLAAAREWFERAMATAKDTLAGKTDEELLAPIADGEIMGGAPRMAIVSGITDHTAHHRGALTVYARLGGLVPPNPYVDAAPDR